MQGALAMILAAPSLSYNTNLNADCVEFCPLLNHQNILLNATYQLNERGNRTGSLNLLEINAEKSLCKELQVISLDSGVFDIKWCPHNMNGKIIVAVALTCGTCSIYYLNKETSKLQQTYSHQEETKQMFTSIDWNNQSIVDKHPTLALSQSNGNLSVWKYTEAELIEDRKWSGHDLYGSPIEAWITAFSQFNPSILFSGGDDSILKGWDLRQSSNLPIWKLQNAHEMGVCSIQSHPTIENCLASGSYDETIHLWDERNMKKPRMSYQTNGGGVWRLKWNPNPARKDILAAACMHKGCLILQIDESIQLKQLYKGHNESLAYGIDWLREEKSLVSHQPWLASCSFYDNSLHLWQAYL